MLSNLAFKITMALDTADIVSVSSGTLGNSEDLLELTNKNVDIKCCAHDEFLE